MELTQEQLQIFTNTVFKILDSDDEIYISYQGRILKNSADLNITCFTMENLHNLTSLTISPPYNEKLPFPWGISFYELIRSLAYDTSSNFDMIMQVVNMYLQTIPVIKNIKKELDLQGKGSEKFQYYAKKFFLSIEENINNSLKNAKIKFKEIKYGLPYYYTSGYFDIYTSDGLYQKCANYAQKKSIEKTITNILNKTLKRDQSSYHYNSNCKMRFEDGGMLTATAKSFYIQIKNNDYANIGMDPILEDIPILSLKK